MNQETPLQRQYRRNAEGLERMLAKAETTGKKVGGYTAADLRTIAADYRTLSVAR